MSRRPGGFSMVELLVVVAIIAVLAALLLGGVQLVRNMAKATACGSNLRQIGMAFELFAADKNGCYPPAMLHSASEAWLGGSTKTYEFVGKSDFGNNWNTWVAYVSPFLASGQTESGTSSEQVIFRVMQCPTHPRRKQQAAGSTGTDVQLWNSEGGVSYGISTAYLGAVPAASAYAGGVSYPNGRNGWPGYGLGISGMTDNARLRSRMSKPGQTISVAEHLGQPVATQQNRSNWTDPPFTRIPVDSAGVAATVPADFGSWAAGYPFADTLTGFALRVAHGSKSNYLFVDGRVGSLTPWETCSADPSQPNLWTGR